MFSKSFIWNCFFSLPIWIVSSALMLQNICPDWDFNQHIQMFEKCWYETAENKLIIWEGVCAFWHPLDKNVTLVKLGRSNEATFLSFGLWNRKVSLKKILFFCLFYFLVFFRSKVSQYFLMFNYCLINWIITKLLS